MAVIQVYKKVNLFAYMGLNFGIGLLILQQKIYKTLLKSLHQLTNESIAIYNTLVIGFVAPHHTSLNYTCIHTHITSVCQTFLKFEWKIFPNLTFYCWAKMPKWANAQLYLPKNEHVNLKMAKMCNSPQIHKCAKIATTGGTL